MTHPVTTAMLAQEVYQEIHMLSHGFGSLRGSESGRVKEQQAENRRLERELQRSAAKSAESLAAKNRQIERLTTRLARAREAELQLEQLQSGETLHKMAARIEALEGELVHAARRTERAERRNRLRLDNGRSQAPIPVLDTTQDCSTCCDADSCPRVDLGGRCILCFGSLTGTTDRYRELVEGCNGQFLHHDGGKEDNSQQQLLQELLPPYPPRGGP